MVASTRPSESVFERWRQKGLLAPLFYAFRRSILSRRDTVLLSRPLDPFTARDTAPNYQIRQVTSDDLPFAKTHFGGKIHHFTTILADPAVTAVGAFHHVTGDLIGINFYTTEDYYDPFVYRYRFTVPTGHVYQFAVEVAPEFRRTPVLNYILNAAAQYWRDKGYQRFLSAVDLSNEPSLRLHFHGGYEETGSGLVTYRFVGVFAFAKPYTYKENRFDALRQRHFQRMARKAANKSAQGD